MKITKEYEASGIVVGYLWGGSRGGYPACDYSVYSSKKKLLAEIKKDFKDGSLDSGMGFESLIAATMKITTISKLDYEGKSYFNEESETILLGKPTKEEKAFLEGCSSDFDY